jgi:hypothetical protein
MAAPTREDAALLIQINQWMAMTVMCVLASDIWSEEFDPETADWRDEAVSGALGLMETIGTLVKHDLFSYELAVDWLWWEGMWKLVGPAALKAREAAGEPRLYENAEAMVSRG